MKLGCYLNEDRLQVPLDNIGNIKMYRGVHAIDYALLDGKSGTEVLQKHPHPTINSPGGREGWVSLGVSAEAGKQLECSNPHDVNYEPGCGAPCVYVRTNSYSDTNAEELALTANETQGYPSEGAEDEETAIIFKLECHQKELNQCSIAMKRLIARNTFKTKTGGYEGFLDQYVQEVLEQFPSHQDKKPMEETRQPQDHLGITGSEALTNTGPQVLPFQSHQIFHSSQDARIQYAPEAMCKFSSCEQVQEQMTCPKESKGNSQDSGYSTAPEAIVKFGQMIPPSQALAISLFTQYARTQDAPEAMVKFYSHEQVQEQMHFPKEAKGYSQDSGYSTTPEAMVKSGQTSLPYQALATSPFTQDARNFDALEAMPKSEGRTSMDEPLWTILQNKAANVGYHESNTMQDSNKIM
jgi:hypothetical protein